MNINREDDNDNNNNQEYNSATKQQQVTDYLEGLEDRLKLRSEQLEDLHLEAAIDAQLTVVPSNSPTIPDESTRATTNHPQHPQQHQQQQSPIFDDYVNPHAVHNCLSPFVPTPSQRIEAVLDWVGLQADDVFLDIGCGDGRVCVAAAKLKHCRAIGIDVSPLCMDLARNVAQEEGVAGLCTFFQADATLDPDVLFTSDASLASALQSATVIFLYTYPTLLLKLIPLLARLTKDYHVRAVVTLTYHLPDQHVTLLQSDPQYDFRWYSQVLLLE